MYHSTSPYAYVRNNPISRTDFLGLWEDGGDGRDGGDDYDIPEIEVTDTRPNWYKEMMQSMDLVENLGTDYEDWNYQNERRDDGGRDLKYEGDPDNDNITNIYGSPESEILTLIGSLSAFHKAYSKLKNKIETAQRMAEILPYSFDINTGKTLWSNPKYLKAAKWLGVVGTAGDIASIIGTGTNLWENKSAENIVDFGIALIGIWPLYGDAISLHYTGMKTLMKSKSVQSSFKNGDFYVPPQWRR